MFCPSINPSVKLLLTDLIITDILQIIDEIFFDELFPSMIISVNFLLTNCEYNCGQKTPSINLKILVVRVNVLIAVKLHHKSLI
jgi:hypothetical protein